MERFKKILCVTDTCEECTVEIAQAVQLVEHNQGSLTIATVTPKALDYPTIETPPEPGEQEACTKKIEAKVAPYRQCLDIRIKTLTGKPYQQIIREVLRDGYDLVMKVRSEACWKKRLISRTDMHLLGKCPCPVWLVNAKQPDAMQSILATVDVSQAGTPSESRVRAELNLRILEIASTMALFNRAELHIAQAWHLIGESAMRGSFLRTPEQKIIESLEEEEKYYADRLDALVHGYFHSSRFQQKERDILFPRVHLIKGWEHKEVPVLAKQIDADVLIMGAVARTGIADFTMGNNAKSIFRQLEGSFLLIKQPGFVTPVKLT